MRCRSRKERCARADSASRAASRRQSRAARRTPPAIRARAIARATVWAAANCGARSMHKSATAGSKTRSRIAAGASDRHSRSQRSATTAFRRQTRRGDGPGIERTCVRYRTHPVAGEPVTAFLEMLAGDNALVVPALDQSGILEPAHHLIKRGRAVLDAVRGQQRAKITAGPLGAVEGVEDQVLEMGDR